MSQRNNNKKPPQTLLVLCGPPSSGKSTFRIEFLKDNPNYIAVSRDDLRYMMRNEGWLPGVLEGIITDVVDGLILEALKAGKSVIADATHCNLKSIRHYDKFQKQFPGLRIRYKVFDVPFDELVERDSKRERKVGLDVLNKMYAGFQELMQNEAFKRQLVEQNREPVIQDKTLPMAVICDLDGTLALFEGKRSPFDASRCDETDDLNIPVAMAVTGFAMQGVKILFVSGREDKDEAPTRRFLETYMSHVDWDLHMRSSEREAGVNDCIVKERIVREKILPFYHTIAIFDDRLRVLNLFYSLLPNVMVFNCNNNKGEY